MTVGKLALAELQIEETLANHAITRKQLCSASHLPSYVAARREIAVALKTKVGLSYPEIGLLLNRHWTSVRSLCCRPKGRGGQKCG